MSDPLGIVGQVVTLPDGSKSRVVSVSPRPNEPDIVDVSIEIQPVQPISFVAQRFSFTPSRPTTRMLTGPQHVEFFPAMIVPLNNTNPCGEIEIGQSEMCRLLPEDIDVE